MGFINRAKRSVFIVRVVLDSNLVLAIKLAMRIADWLLVQAGAQTALVQPRDFRVES